MPGLLMAKAGEEDLQTTKDFMNACEMALEGAKFSMMSPEENWMELDDEEEDKQEILRIRKRIAKEERISEDAVDNRILMYEFLQGKFQAASCNWRRVVWGADILIENVCDPTEDHIAFYPGFELFHVSPEM